jgi:hypothetical protein
MIKNILIGTVLVLVMIASAGATEVRVDPASQTIAAGDPFHVDIIIEDVADLVADQAILNFDPDVMHATGIIEGDFLKTVGSTLGVGEWDNTEGTATFSYSFSNLLDKVSGSGTLATIEFNTYPDAPSGTYDLSLTDVMLINISDAEISTDTSDGTVTILNETYQRGDLNHDNEITPTDALIALQIAVGSRPFDGAADVSGDGQVTALDALMILQAAVD